jgi:hypothetical protein
LSVCRPDRPWMALASVALKARTNRVPGNYVSDSSDDAEPAHCAASLTHSRHGRGKTCRGKAGSLGLPSSCGAPRVLRIATGRSMAAVLPRGSRQCWPFGFSFDRRHRICDHRHRSGCFESVKAWPWLT